MELRIQIFTCRHKPQVMTSTIRTSAAFESFSAFVTRVPIYSASDTPQNTHCWSTYVLNGSSARRRHHWLATPQAKLRAFAVA
jgi:hypothetical protein